MVAGVVGLGVGAEGVEGVDIFFSFCLFLFSSSR